MDKIRLKNMRFYGYHGCYPSEKEIGQLFEVDVDISCDLSLPGMSDCLGDTVNYLSVFQKIKSVVEAETHNLLERVAQRISDIVLEEQGALSVVVRIRKPGVALGGVLDTVEIEVSRCNVR